MTRTGRDASRLTVSRVTGDLFGVWELRTQLGRGLQPEDDATGATRVAVLSDRYWREACAAAPEALGTTIMLDGVPHTIVGVLSPDVEFGTFANIAMWVSYPLQPGPSRDVRQVMVTGRLVDGYTADDAAAEFLTLAANLEREHPDSNRGRRTLVLPASRAMGGPNLWLVMTLLVGTAALVTVVASVNVAGVLLARAVVRQREFALRIALGARKRRVFRQLVAEGLILAGFGAGGGLMVTELGLRLIRSVDAEPIFQQLEIDGHEVAFVAALALISPVLFSLAPALASLRVNLIGALNAAGARTTGAGRRLRDALVAAQLALAVALAVVGGLVARTAAAQMTAPNGFDAAELVMFTMTFDHLEDPVARRQLAVTIERQLQDRGIGVAQLSAAPAAAIEAATVIEPHGVPPASGVADAWAHQVAVSERAFATLGVSIVAGRDFTAHDIDSHAAVALVSHEAAMRYYGGDEAAVGRSLVVRQGIVRRAYQIVGVTADVRNSDPERGMPPRVWVPLAEPLTTTFVARGGADVASTTASIREVARQAAPGVPVESLEGYARAIARLQGGDRVAMGMLISFAAMAIVFAAIGLYGTVAVSASHRRAEFATRYALGAQQSNVARLVMWQAFRLLALGLVPGLVLGLIAATGMRRLLFGVTPLDPFNIAAVVSLLLVMTLVASAAPALRAARLDAMSVLKGG
jgi:predicted permease